MALHVTSNFQSYSTGIFTDTTCAGLEVNHAVILDGYGVDANGTSYYILRNSWGTKWGMILKFLFFLNKIFKYINKRCEWLHEFCT